MGEIQEPLPLVHKLPGRPVNFIIMQISVVTAPTAVVLRRTPPSNELQSSSRFNKTTAVPWKAGALVHREPPLDDHAPEKSRQEMPKGSNFCSETAALGVGFVCKGPGNSGDFSRA